LVFPAESSEREARRLETAYAEQGRLWSADRFRSWHPGNLLRTQECERVALGLLYKHGCLPLADKRILDAGCGPGKFLISLIPFGAEPANLHGVDLIAEKIETARRLGPNIDFRVADAAELPFPDASFDLVFAWTLFSSIAEPERRLRVAEDLRRVLRPRGAVVWCDFWMTSPSNPWNQGIRLREVRRLFPGWRVDARRVSLLPQLARAVAPRSWRFASLLSEVPFLRTHWLALLRRR
jgi:ubiquinone/menaquinone biosynthesis C-methylase UbiE